MGLIKAVTSTIGGSLADQWLEVIEANEMDDKTVFTNGVAVQRDSKRGSNKKGTANTVSNGSVIHVQPNQFMMVVDGGKIVDFSAEEGYFTVENSSLPSMFGGGFGTALQEAFGRFKYGGVTPTKQQVFFVNLQEIKGIKFGTPAPINYFDNFYNAELFLRAHGTYSIKITNPLLFYAEAVPRNAERVQIEDIYDQYQAEFLSALQATINQMSADGERISYLPSKSRELSRYMGNTLDEEWKQMRGMEVQSVGIASITYDDESTKLINMRNQGAILSDPTIREGFVQGSVARGMEAAGSNSAGAGAAFMGMGVGMQAGGGFVGAASQSNQAQMAAQQQQQQAAQQQANTWACVCGAQNTGKFCSSCGKPKPAPAGSWACECGAQNSGKFCASCGKAKPAVTCAKCGYDMSALDPAPKFCPNCGNTL